MESAQVRPLIALEPVTSSNLAAVGYDTATQTLAVKFHSSETVHHYSDVPPEKFERMQTAKSIGSFFSREVRAQHPHRAIEPDAE